MISQTGEGVINDPEWPLAILIEKFPNCCVFRPANACLDMLLHGQKQQKTFENDEKSIFFIMHARGLRRKTKKKVCW